MLQRLIQLTDNHHFFLFGARNTGKSTLLAKRFPETSTAWFDLLDTDLERQLTIRPDNLFDMVQALPNQITHVIIDEVQKIPELLNVVQRLMKKHDKIFIMSGSSARKLKKAGINLLGGRAFVYHLYPLTYKELGEQFNLMSALQWGTLPEILLHSQDTAKRQFLHAYAHTYLKEEVIAEQLVKDLTPFRRFLEVAAQCNGKIINYSKIARDVGVDDKTAKFYFGILEDTLIGYFLEPYHNSIRKRVSQKPKFYFFDTGIVRALTNNLTVPLVEKTMSYGNAFEHFIINQCITLASYYQNDYKFFYLRTLNDNEIDLIIERPGKKKALIEIKSSREVNESMLRHFIKLSNEFDNAESYCLSNDPYAKKFQHVLALPWQTGLDTIFEGLA